MKSSYEKHNITVSISKSGEENVEELIKFLDTEMSKVFKVLNMENPPKIDSGAIVANTTTSPITYGGHVNLSFNKDNPLKVSSEIIREVPSAQISFA